MCADSINKDLINKYERETRGKFDEKLDTTTKLHCKTKKSYMKYSFQQQ